MGGEPLSLACTMTLYLSMNSRSRASEIVVVISPMWESMVNKGFLFFLGTCVHGGDGSDDDGGGNNGGGDDGGRLVGKR